MGLGYLQEEEVIDRVGRIIFQCFHTDPHLPLLQIIVVCLGMDTVGCGEQPFLLPSGFANSNLWFCR